MTTTERTVNIPVCHPDRPYYARELCRRCYDRRRDEFPRRNNGVSTALASRAERLRAELQAAGPYAPVPSTWGAVARQLGVKPKTLEKARQRAKQYAARGSS